jgi:Arc/MetJ family transcription regulator
MSTAQATQTLYVRDVPKDLIEAIDEFAAETKGNARVASRPQAVILLLQRAIAEAKRKSRKKGT